MSRKLSKCVSILILVASFIITVPLYGCAYQSVEESTHYVEQPINSALEREFIKGPQ